MEYLYYIKTYEYDKNNMYIVKSLSEQTTDSIEHILNNFINKETDYNVINIIKLTNDKVNLLIEDKNEYDNFCEAFTKLIYFDNKWKIEYFDEPNFKILNSFDIDKSIIVYLIGDSFKEYTKTKLNDLSDKIEKIYFIENKNIVFFNNKKDNNIDIDTLLDSYTMFDTDKNKECVFIFDYNCGLQAMLDFYYKIKKYKNNDILLYSDNIIFRISKESAENELIFERVYKNDK